MGRARDEAGNIWETDASGNPTRLLQPATNMPGEPAFDLERPKVESQISSANASAGNAAANAEQTRVKTGQLVRQNPISQDDQKVIDKYRQQAAIAASAIKELDRAAQSVDRFGTSPEHAAQVSRSIIPKDAGLIDETIAKGYQWWNDVKPQEQADYQNLDRLQQARVASIQQEQAGPQTESDALRYMKSTFGPDKFPGVNASTIAEAKIRAQIDAARPDLYLKWANKFGSLSALNSAGKSVDEWFQKDFADRMWHHYHGMTKAKREGRQYKPEPYGVKQSGGDVESILGKYGL